MLSAGDFVAVLIRVSLAWLFGFMGLLSMLKGAKGGVHAAGVRKGHVGSDAQRAHEILAAAGPHAAVVLVRCKDQQTRQTVAAAAADSAQKAGMARLRSFSLPLTPVALTTGCARRSASAPARAGRRTGPR